MAVRTKLLFLCLFERVGLLFVPLDTIMVPPLPPPPSLSLSLSLSHSFNGTSSR